jgi:nucleotide-binding universal stress UspA family protein
VIQLNRILCPVDFSDCSKRALDHAVAIASWYEAELSVLHVFADRPSIDMLPTPVIQPRRPPVQAGLERTQEVARDLHRFIRTVTIEGVVVEEAVQEAPDVAAEILAQARVRKADLLVLGSHGRSGVKQLLLGSVTERVMRTSETPTMVVPIRVDHVAFGHAAPFKRILCPVDFSTSALNALTDAMALAEEADAILTIVHVIDISPELREAAEEAGFPIAQVRINTEASCRLRLEALVPDSVRGYSAVDTVVAEGKPATEILRLADERNADLIVMGVHGRGAADLLLFGSKTHEVIRAGRCPVLAVRSRT